MKVLLTEATVLSAGQFMINLRKPGHPVRVYERAIDRRDDIIDHDRLAAAASGCDAVIHLAAKVGLGVNIGDIDEYARHNDYGTAVLLRVAAEAGISRFLYASPFPVGLTPLNIGTPWVMTVGEMAAELSRTLGGPAPVVTGQYRLGDVRHITADCSAAEQVLGWRAQTDLAHGLADLSVSQG